MKSWRGSDWYSVLAMLWSGYCHVRAESQCEANKLLHDIADVMGQDGLRINNAQYSLIVFD